MIGLLLDHIGDARFKELLAKAQHKRAFKQQQADADRQAIERLVQEGRSLQREMTRKGKRPKPAPDGNVIPFPGMSGASGVARRPQSGGRPCPA
jgi:hypothetical protein